MRPGVRTLPCEIRLAARHGHSVVGEEISLKISEIIVTSKLVWLKAYLSNRLIKAESSQVGVDNFDVNSVGRCNSFVRARETEQRAS